MGATPFDRAVRRIAARQYGAFSARQALHVGGTRAMMQQRVRRDDFAIAADGVYVLSGAPTCWRQRLWIALLEAGDGAVVAGRAAAALWCLPGFRDGPVEVVAQHGRKNHRLTVGVLRESRLLPIHHVHTIDGIAVTSIERTLFALAADGHPKKAERAVDNALARAFTSPERLWRTWGELAARGRPGTRVMRAILAIRLPGYVAPASELEALFRTLLEAEGMELPDRQVDLGGDGWIGRVDCYFRRVLVVELDGRVGHISELDRGRDRQRDNELMAEGLRVLRFTWEDLVMRPKWVVSTLRRALASAA